MTSSIQDSIVAIDGFSSCGKSTLAKDLAIQLGYRFIDSGAMYRATTLYFMDHNIKLSDENEVAQALDHIIINFELIEGKNTTLLNSIIVEDKIRTLRISNHVSEVAAIKSVRVKMVQLQQEMGKNKNIVMDGRDIGSVVFPDAKHKFFVTASPFIRVERRYQELITKGDDVRKEDIKANLEHRDHIDSTRVESPLIKTDQHILIDNSYLSREEQTMIAMKHILEKQL